jgi:hypothetical protein
MGSKKSLYQIPLPSTEFEGGVSFCGHFLRFQYRRDGAPYHSGIRFNKTASSRTRAERCCTAWHVEGGYDTLVEVEGSTWVEEIRGDTQAMWRDKWEMHHYMIYLDSAGCFEVIAESWEVLPEESGAWPKT